MKKLVIIMIVLFLTGCGLRQPHRDITQRGLIPAEAFSSSYRQGNIGEFSIYDGHGREQVRARMKQENESLNATSTTAASVQATQVGAYLEQQGFELKKSWNPPAPQIPISAFQKNVINQPVPIYQEGAGAPPGSMAPYFQGQMTANPSLWSDSVQTVTLFDDFRAKQAMDIITVVINESAKGTKSTDTETESTFSLLAGITEFFGLETSTLAANNESLSPAALIDADTELSYEAEGDTEREGTLTAKISAVIMEVLPNGLLRVEGTKIVSVDAEEEVLVISGLVRSRDIDAKNQVDSSRVANMRIDFYGQGILADQQNPGWALKIFDRIWPF